MQRKKTIGIIIKIGVVFFALFFLYEQITSKTSVKEFNINHILLQLEQNVSLIYLVIFMMFLNWFLESLKWRFLISRIEKYLLYVQSEQFSLELLSLHLHQIG